MSIDLSAIPFPDKQRAVALYAILDRDWSDFLDMLPETSDDALRVLYLMLATPNASHDAHTERLNKIGADSVAAQLKRREVPLPLITSN